LTGNKAECIVCIAISKKNITNMETDICEWNLDKKLSDHKGNLLELKNDSENKKSKINNCLLLFIGFCAFN